jgi:hypothetical protein
MAENNENRNVRNDEIDLLDLFARMGKTINSWARALGRAFLITIVFIFRKWIPLSLSIVIGVFVSFFMKSTSSSLYTSDIVFKSNTVPASDILPYLKRLHTYCLEGNKEALGDALSLDQTAINNIIDLNSFYIIDLNRDSIPDYVEYDENQNVIDTTTTKMQDRFDIRLQMKSLQELITVRNGLISFIEKDSLLKQRTRLRLRQNQELLARINIDILQLDSLQKVKYFEETRNQQARSGGQMVFLQEQKTQLVYSDIYNLYKKKQVLESELTLYKDVVSVLREFSIPAKSVSGAVNYRKQITLSLFCLTLLVLVIIENRKKLLEVYNKYK